MQTLYFSYTLQTKAAAVAAVVVILISLIGLCVTSSVTPLGIQMNGFPNATVHWSQLLLQQGPVYEVKVPTSDGCSTIWNEATPLRTRGNTVKNYELNMFGNQMFLTNELNIWVQFVEKLFSKKFWIYLLINWQRN